MGFKIDWGFYYRTREREKGNVCLFLNVRLLPLRATIMFLRDEVATFNLTGSQNYK